MQNAENQNDIVKVSSFKEKPDLNTAKAYLEAGNYLWNAGIFVWNTDTVVSEIRSFAPRIAAVIDELFHSFYTPSEQDELSRLFPLCDKISIDYAVMEKSPHVWCIPASWPWDDLGSFASIEKVTGRLIPQEIKDAQEEYQKNKRG